MIYYFETNGWDRQVEIPPQHLPLFTQDTLISRFYTGTAHPSAIEYLTDGSLEAIDMRSRQRYTPWAVKKKGGPQGFCWVYLKVKALFPLKN